MNKCIFLGRFTKNTETNDANGLLVAKNSLALDRGKDKDGNDRGTDFIRVIAFGKRAEFMQKYVTQGRRFLVETHVQTGDYTNKDGVKVYTTDFIVDSIEFADSKPAENAPTTPANDDYMDIPNDIDEELPFN